MKTVYFVRHGESEANVHVEAGSGGTFQGDASPLSAKGREQAAFIAKRCTKLPIDVILSSTAVRAHSTAEEIRRATGKPLELHDLFVERKGPKRLNGGSRDDPAMQALLKRWHETLYTSGKRYEDGENFDDVKGRVIAALEMLAARPEQHIVVATHGFFLHMVHAVVALGQDLTAEEFARMAQKLWMNNTGITQIQYFTPADGKRMDGSAFEGWVLHIWNDHAHLG